MTDDHALAVPWWRALSIAERLACGAPVTVDVRQGERRYARWRQLTALKNAADALVDDALRPLGVTRDGLVALLGEPDDALRRRAGAPPTWALTLDEWWTLGTDVAALPDMRLLNVIRPLIAGARAELTAALGSRHGSLRAIGLSAEVADQLVEGLHDAPPFDALANIVSPTMILEVQLARRAGRLDGATSEDRYRSYTDQLANPSTAADVLTRYPSLARLVHDRLRFWVDARIEFADRMLADFEQISSVFWGGRLPSQIQLTCDQGDSHRRGRSVIVLTTDVGGVVYKPRSAGMDVAFDALLESLNSGGAQWPLARGRILDRVSHGWFELVRSEPPSPEEVEPAAWRLGALTALFHALRATDMHHENVLLTGADPHAIDLESLLHTERRYASTVTHNVVNVAYEGLVASCVNVGVLPNRIVTGSAEHPIVTDVSVMGYVPGQQAPLTMPRIIDQDTDRIRVVVDNGLMDQPGEEKPQPQPPWQDHSTEFAKGFDFAYRHMCARSDLWLPGGAFHEAFAGTVTRYIPRATMVYAKILIESCHPDFVADGLDRHLCLGKLLAGYRGRSDRVPMIASETAALWSGDIPYFLVHAGTGVVIHEGADRLTTHLPDAPLTHVAGHCATVMGEADLAIQQQVIELSFHTIGAGPTPGPRATALAGADLAERKCQHARELAAWLRRRALGDERGIGWLTLAGVNQDTWIVKPMVIDIYGGLSGIALALETVSWITGDPAVADLHRRVMAQLEVFVATLDDPPSVVRALDSVTASGGYGHYAGLALAFGSAARASDHEQWRTACRSAVEVLMLLAGTDRAMDVVTGNAGAILVASSVEDVVGTALVRRAVSALTEPLVRSAVRDEHGAAWRQADGQRPLIGFSHGTTGIGRALARASRILGDDSLRELALDAFRYERQFLAPDRLDWPDLRSDAPDGHMRAWCHGSPGAALGRALALVDLGPSDESVELVSEIQSAARAVVETFRPRAHGALGVGNHSLCHGDVGNLICLETVKALGHEVVSPEWLDETWSSVLDDAENRGWTGGAANGAVLPDLMMGVAGMAWGLSYSTDRANALNLLALESIPTLAAGVFGEAR